MTEIRALGRFEEMIGGDDRGDIRGDGEDFLERCDERGIGELGGDRPLDDRSLDDRPLEDRQLDDRGLP
jgi:hypothetical protein